MPSNDTIFDFAAMRKAMIDSQLRPNAVEEKWILTAMALIAREDYVPTAYRNTAYMDRSVPLGHGRYLVPALTSALMLQKADISEEDHILYIGGATGYNVTIASARAASIVAVDPDMQAPSSDNVTPIKAALNEGAPSHGPYSLIIIEGAVEQVPQNITDQLADGGRLVCGLADGEVSQLCIGYKRASSMALVPFMECEIERFTGQAAVGFEREKEFSF